MESLFLLLSTYFLVMALGLQSQFVNNGHYMGAFMNSFMIGAGNLVLFKLAPNASPIEMIAFLSGGPLGIISSMWVYRLIKDRKNFKQGA
jgi:hypothetical protein